MFTTLFAIKQLPMEPVSIIMTATADIVTISFPFIVLMYPTPYFNTLPNSIIHAF